MKYLICFILSSAILVSGIVSILFFKKPKKEKENRIRSVNKLIITTIASAMVMFFPIYYSLFEKEARSIGSAIFVFFQALLGSIHNVMRLFILDGEYSFVAEKIKDAPKWLHLPYSALASVLFVIAPVLTFSVILSLLKNAYSSIAFAKSYYKDMYVFSELNKRSLVLAKSIKSNHPKAKIIFTNVFENETEETHNLVQETKLIGATCFQNDITYLRLHYHSSSKRIVLFLLSDKEADNIRDSVFLIEKYRDRKNTEIYVFAGDIEGELLLSSVDKHHMKVRRINDRRSLVSNYIYRNGLKIYEDAFEDDESGKKIITTVMVGMGAFGTEMMKTLVWYCQMDGYELELEAFDSDINAENKFTALCPELMDSKHNGNKSELDAVYTIKIHSGVDVRTQSFIDEIKKISNPTCLFVSLGEEKLNVKTAVELRKEFERQGRHPRIIAIVEDGYINKRLEKIHNFKNQQYDLEFIGALDQAYSEETIMESELEKKALDVHLEWGEEDDFWKYEYNYRSSVATAIHNQVKEHYGLMENNYDSERIVTLEHRRWNAYMRTEGYIYSGSRDKNSRNDLAKMHPDLVTLDKLTDEDIEKDLKAAKANE